MLEDIDNPIDKAQFIVGQAKGVLLAIQFNLGARTLDASSLDDKDILELVAAADTLLSNVKEAISEFAGQKANTAPAVGALLSGTHEGREAIDLLRKALYPKPRRDQAHRKPKRKRPVLRIVPPRKPDSPPHAES